jgi:ABC-type Fe3+-hydroxamate transport system substrate-binding protein
LESRVYTDQLQRQVRIPYPPRRIVSLVPSQTELLYHLGLEAEVAGITKFCIHPAHWFRDKTRVGGTKNLRLEQVLALQPQLVIANKEENERDQVAALAEAGLPVWVSDIHNLEDALQMIEQVGEITGRSDPAQQISATIRGRFSNLRTPDTVINTAYFIWRKPWMVAGGDTFIHEMLRRCGLQNVFAGIDRYPEISLAQLADRDCQLVLLSSEPYPFKEQHIAEIQAVLPHARVILVDGEMFSWYGSRLLEAPGYFSALFGL